MVDGLIAGELFADDLIAGNLIAANNKPMLH